MRPSVVFALLIVLTAAVAIAADSEPSPKGVVNINTAEGEQLQLLPRVGPALAERIINFREIHGPFKSTDELVAVRGIGESSLEQLRPFVVVNGETTLEVKIRLPRPNASEANE
jgi:competence protein ComEA